MILHTVTQGECLSSIAFENGFFVDTLWNLPENAELKATRKDPNTLQPGDIVSIPDKRLKEVEAVTQVRHRFRLRGVPARLRVQIRDHTDAPMGNSPFTLTVDGNTQQGRTDAEGMVIAAIAPNAKEGMLEVGEGEERLEYAFRLGALDPKDTITGIQARLNNLGFSCGEIDGAIGEKTQNALRTFQTMSGLPTTGQADAATIAKLAEAHGN